MNKMESILYHCYLVPLTLWLFSC